MGAAKSNQNLIRTGAVLLGMALIFGPFQNCTVYESPDRKELNEKGFDTATACMPYLDISEASEIMGGTAKAGFLATATTGQTCSVSLEGAGTKGIGSFRCTISSANVDSAKNPGTDVTFIGGPPQAPFYHYSYARQDTQGSSIQTYVTTVGTVESAPEGVRCGAVFDGSPTAADQQRAVDIGLALVDLMAHRIP